MLEATAVREVEEEVGLRIDGLRYVESHSFIFRAIAPVVDVVFLARYTGGEPRALNAGEVAEVR